MITMPDRASWAIAVSALVLLTSCTAAQYQADHLDEHIGRATREEVIALVGPPQEAQALEGGGERWVYQYNYTVIGGTAAAGHRTCWENILTFDKHGILQARERRQC